LRIRLHRAMKEIKAMLDLMTCTASSALELDEKIREIFALDQDGRGNEISGTLNVYYSDETVKLARLLPLLQTRGVEVEWHQV
jgi:hypothetical protein